MLYISNQEKKLIEKNTGNHLFSAYLLSTSKNLIDFNNFQDGETTDSPSISGSTQSVSPPTTSTGPGVKASDWVRSLQLKTPSKSESQEETITAEDSAKKKKKHSRWVSCDQGCR